MKRARNGQIEGELDMKVLLGNTYPPALVRRGVKITPIKLEEAKKNVILDGFESFWGHSNTIQVANKLLEIDVTPKTERPVLSLSEDFFPILNGKIFTKVLVLSPSYVGAYRPQIGEEVGEDKIIGWQCLLWDFD